MPLGNTRSYAKHRGISQPTVSKAIASGKLKNSISRKGKRWVIDFELADWEWEQKTAERRTFEPDDTPPPSPGIKDDLSLHEARRLNEVRKLELNDLELARKRGEWIDASEARKTVFGTYRMFRDRMTAQIPRVTRVVLASDDETSAILAAKAEFNRVLTEMSQAFEREFTEA